MENTEFKDRIFDLLNDTDDLPIADLDVNDAENQIKVTLNDGTQFMITIESYGRRFILKP